MTVNDDKPKTDKGGGCDGKAYENAKIDRKDIINKNSRR